MLARQKGSRQEGRKGRAEGAGQKGRKQGGYREDLARLPFSLSFAVLQAFAKIARSSFDSCRSRVNSVASLNFASFKRSSQPSASSASSRTIPSFAANSL